MDEDIIYCYMDEAGKFYTDTKPRLLGHARQLTASTMMFAYLESIAPRSASSEEIQAAITLAQANQGA